MLDIVGYNVNNSGARHVLFLEFGTTITDGTELKRLIEGEFTEKVGFAGHYLAEVAHLLG